jgi:hypothetical protein
MATKQEVLRYIDTALDEIQDTMANLLAAEDGLKEVKELVLTGGAGDAHKSASGYIEGAQGACTNLSLTADKLLRWLSACDGQEITEGV